MYSVEELKTLYVNDIAGYSKTLNECYLTSTTDLTVDDYEHLILHKKKINSILSNSNIPKAFISKYWAPKNDNNIKEGERVYYTHENACRLDKMMSNNVKKIPKFIIGPLVKCSIHNNTSGQFSAYYKHSEKTKGKFGGKTETDLHRITKEITPELPILTQHRANIKISQMDTNDWVKTIPEVDLMYYDPPYNKHPYNIYYFLLDIINNWDIIGKVLLQFCSSKSFEDLIKIRMQGFYNNKGIIL